MMTLRIYTYIGKGIKRRLGTKNAMLLMRRKIMNGAFGVIERIN